MNSNACETAGTDPKMCGEFQAVSLHDGVLCKKSDSAAIAARMAEEVFTITGIRVSVKVEDKREALVNL